MKIDAVRKFLLEGEIFGVLREDLSSLNVPESRASELLDLADAVIDRKVSPKIMPEFIQKAFGVDEKTAKHLALTLAGHRLLPLEHYIPGLKAQILAWGGKLSDFPSRRIEKDRALTELLVARLSAEQGVALPDYLQKRLVYLATGYLSKKRAKEPTIELMQRPSNLGGLALSKEASEHILDAISKSRDEFEALRVEETGVEDVEEEEIELEEEVEEVKEEETAEELVIPVEPATVLHLEEDELEMTPEALKKLADRLQDDAPAVDAEAKAVGEAIGEPEITVEALLEWIRILQDDSGTETGKELIGFDGQEEETGGAEILGISEEETLPPHSSSEPLPALKPSTAVAADVPIIAGEMISEKEKEEVAKHELMLALSGTKKESEEEKMAREQKVNTILQEIVPLFRKKRLSQQVFQEVASGHVRGRREALRTAELLREKYGFTEAESDGILAVLERAKGEALKGGEVEKVHAASELEKRQVQLAQKEQEILDKRHASLTGKVTEAGEKTIGVMTQVSAARSKEEELLAQEAAIDTAKVQQAEAASKPQKAKTKLSVQSLPPVAGKVTDVVFSRTLAGPVDELRQMTAVEFRRLSSDANEATRKIEDKLALLQEASYEERIRGVRAWRESAVNRLYLDMTREALEKGQSFAEVAANRRNAGKESLSPAEASAVMALNRRIKF